MKFKLLMDATKEIWGKYNEHQFVRGIETGLLDKDVFKYYIIQDYLYLQEYAKVFAIGIAKAKSLDTIQLFSKYINILTDGEMDIHKGYMGKFQVTQEEVDATKMSLDNLSYTSYMLRIAYEGTEVEILAAILACAYSYEIIAKKIIENNPTSINHEFYGDWIKGYSSEAYSKGNEVLITLFESLISDYSEKEMKHIIDIFVNCSIYEYNFWEMSFNKLK
ncbi:MAG: thiaminase II [Mycoplasma sp.]